jgi:hypothetical protein
MSDLIRSGFQKLIAFVIVDAGGGELIGIGNTFTVELSKNGASFMAGSGTKDEIGSGWYSYLLTVSETDTLGPLALRVTAAGAIQQNLLYQVSGSGSIWSEPGGTNILTAAEAAIILRCEDDDANMLMLLPQIDWYIKYATGRDWALDETINPVAKGAARILLVQWYETPGMLGQGITTLGAGLISCLVQLEAQALELEEQA